jgi:hypothetical protein
MREAIAQYARKSNFRALLMVTVLGSFICLCGIPCVHAQDPNADAQWGLAEHLFEEGEFYRAITEYKRFMYYFPEDARTPIAQVREVESYVRGEWWDEGLRASLDLLSKALSGELRARVLYLQGVSQLHLGLLDEARKTLCDVLEVSQDPIVRDKAYYLIGEIYALKENWGDASKAFKEIEPQSQIYDRACQSDRLISARTPLPEKSPWIAGLLAAILPGAGHLYVGRTRDSGLVFSVNAAFTAATVEAIHKDNAALAGGLAAVELLWYAGNVFSAVGSAHKYNRQKRMQLLREIQLPSAWVLELPPLVPDDHGIPHEMN